MHYPGTDHCASPQGHISHPPRGPLKTIAAKADRMNYTTMEDIPEGEQVIIDMFSLNGYPIVILYNSGATHEFISKTCTQKYQLIHTGGDIITKELVMNAPLNLMGKIYKTHLFVLDGQEIDVILRMS
jgi:hypothetical protein